jgi:hypothetical protein
VLVWLRAPMALMMCACSTASRSCHIKLFNMLRLGQVVLDVPDRPLVTLEGLRRLVGEATKWLSSDVIHGLLTLAVRDIAGVRLFDSLLLDYCQPAQLSKNIRRACGGSATKLVVPWNERQGHWSLLCLDLISLTAVFYDSLDGSVSGEDALVLCGCVWQALARRD